MAGLWLWTALRLRRATAESRSPTPGAGHRPMELEDALKAAYELQDAGGAWEGSALARRMGLPESMASAIAGALVGS
ncbi:MAG: hypothetical protein PVG11_08430, partial [Anaerolineae bacterium]